MNPATAPVPIEWILVAIGTLCGVIATLALVIRKQLTDEISNLRGIVNKLQDDVDRLSNGCGHSLCFWKQR